MGKRGPQPRPEDEKGKRVTMYLTQAAAVALATLAGDFGNKSAIVSRLICEEFEKTTGSEKKDRPAG